MIGGEIDPEKRARVDDPPWFGAVGLDPDCPGDHALGWKMASQPFDVIESVEQRDDQARRRTHAFERRVQADGLGRDDEHVDWLVEGRRRRRAGVEVAEKHALHMQPVAVDELGAPFPGHHRDVPAGPRQRPGEEAADTPGPKDCDAGHSSQAIDYARAIPTLSQHCQRARQGTYSIVARDPATGELGVAVQSHWFSVGPIVPWARPGVGAVATQSNVEPAYGPRALDLIGGGAGAEQALSHLVAADEAAASRQVAVVDATGAVAAHTGEQCIAYAGHVLADGVSCQANIMASDRVWPAMLETYLATEGSLAVRLLAALDAAGDEGGDIRGRQSAAILVVPSNGEAWETTVSLRVEDHPEPLRELRRLLVLHDAYALANEADALVAEERFAEAAAMYRSASDLAPDNHELRFWAGLGAAQAGDFDTALDDVRAAIAIQPGWLELLPRIPEAFAPSAPAVLARLRDQA